MFLFSQVLCWLLELRDSLVHSFSLRAISFFQHEKYSLGGVYAHHNRSRRPLDNDHSLPGGERSSRAANHSHFSTSTCLNMLDDINMHSRVMHNTLSFPDLRLRQHSHSSSMEWHNNANHDSYLHFTDRHSLSKPPDFDNGASKGCCEGRQNLFGNSDTYLFDHSQSIYGTVPRTWRSRNPRFWWKWTLSAMQRSRGWKQISSTRCDRMPF
jgi:hypothetical protein